MIRIEHFWHKLHAVERVRSQEQALRLLGITYRRTLAPGIHIEAAH